MARDPSPEYTLEAGAALRLPGPDPTPRPRRRTLATDVEEREIAGFTVRIDRLLCVGFGDCIEAAPDVFVFDDEGIATFVTPAPEPEPDRLRAACDICPVDALTLLDADGAQVVP